MLNNSKTFDMTTISKSSSLRQSLLPWNSMHISYENSIIISSFKKKAKKKSKKKLLINKIILGFLYLVLTLAHAFLDINLILLLLSSSSSSSPSPSSSSASFSIYSIMFLFSFFGLLSSFFFILSLLLLLLSLLLLPSLLRPSLYLLSSSLSSLLACLLTFVLAKEEGENYIWEWLWSIGGITLGMGITIWRIGEVLILWEEYIKKNANDSIKKRLSY